MTKASEFNALKIVVAVLDPARLKSRMSVAGHANEKGGLPAIIAKFDATAHAAGALKVTLLASSSKVLANAFAPSLMTELGSTSDLSLLQPEKAASPISARLVAALRSRDSSESTSSNAETSIFASCGVPCKMTWRTLLQRLKADCPIAVTSAAMLILIAALQHAAGPLPP